MTIELVIEDGSGVSGSNSYATAEEARAYALDRGVDFGGPNDEKLKSFLIIAADYLNSLGYRGTQTYSDAYLTWPRASVFLDNATVSLDDATIPGGIKRAQMQLCIEQYNGVKLFSTSVSGGFVKREKTGPLETEWAVPVSGVPGRPNMPAVSPLLRPYLKAAGGVPTVVGRA